MASDGPTPPPGRPEVTAFFDPETNTISYVVADPASNACAIIDSVLDFDSVAGRIGTRNADALIAFVRTRSLSVEWLIETHLHADHLSAAPYLQAALGGRLAIGERITAAQEAFGRVFNEGSEFERDGSQFDRLFKDGDCYTVGSLAAVALPTPGHTAACMTHVIGDAAFVGDTLFMPDCGTARTDFPGGDAGQLYRSIQRILGLPPATRLFTCHDYGAGGRAVQWETTVAEQRQRNVHVRDGIAEEAFVAMRRARDATLGMPRLIIPAVQVNMRGGRLPAPEAGQRRFLKLPLDGLFASVPPSG